MNRVEETVWNWRRPKVVTDPTASRRKHATIEGAVMITVACVFHFIFHKPVLAIIVGTLSMVVLVGGWIVPPLYSGFKAAGQKLAFAVGQGLTWGLLVPFFYICFGLGRLGLRIRGCDPLNRRFERNLPSYWTPHAGKPGQSQYLKQY